MYIFTSSVTNWLLKCSADCWRIEMKSLRFLNVSLSHPFSTRRASVHSVGPSGLLLRHPDRPVWPEPLQQKPDRAPSPRRDLRYSGGARQPEQRSPLECAKRLQPEPCPWQVPGYLRASVQRSRYVRLPVSPDGFGAKSLSPVNCGCQETRHTATPSGQHDNLQWVPATPWHYCKTGRFECGPSTSPAPLWDCDLVAVVWVISTLSKK